MCFIIQIPHPNYLRLSAMLIWPYYPWTVHPHHLSLQWYSPKAEENAGFDHKIVIKIPIFVSLERILNP